MAIRDMKIYLVNFPEDGDKFKLPVNPIDNFSINLENKLETTDVFGLGEVVLKRYSSLQSFGWKSFFPMNEDDALVFTKNDTYKTEAMQQAEMFKKALKENKSFTLQIVLINDSGINIPYIDVDVIIKKFNTTDEGGQPGDIYYNVDFIEDVEPTVSEYKYNPPVKQSVAATTGGVATTYKKEEQQKDKPTEITVGSIVSINGVVYDKALVETQSKAYESGKYKVPPNGSYYKYLGGINQGSNTSLRTTESKDKFFLQQGTGTVKQIDKNGIDVKYGRIDEMAESVKKENPGTFYQVKLSQNLKKNFISSIGTAIANVLNAFIDGKSESISSVSTVWVKGQDCSLYKGQGSSQGIVGAAVKKG